MAAPSGTVWGSIAGSYGRIGIYTSASSTATETTLTVQIWFWSKYSASDTGNTLYYDNLSSTGSATTGRGSVSISTSVDSGEGWSTSNQKLLKTYTHKYTRTTSNVTRYLYAKLTDVDRVGATMSVNTTFTVPVLASYTVTYNANGGSGAPSAQKKYYGKSLTLSSTKPTRAGYTFAGWSTSSSGSVAYASGASYTANNAVTLYAVWVANMYTVTYNANGGSGAPETQYKFHGQGLTLSTTKPTRANYTFAGWSTSATGVVAYSPGGWYKNDANVTLYAVWKLAYKKPIIHSLKATRCNSSGVQLATGGYAKVNFQWETTNNVASVVIAWESTAGSGSYTMPSSSGTGGAVGVVIGNNALSINATYTITVTVTDTESTTATTTLAGYVFPIDVLTGGNGVAFGKPAELPGVAEFGLEAQFNYPVYGNVMGLNRLPGSPQGDNLNNYMETGCWAVYSNSVAAAVTNLPIPKAGRLEVSAATGEGIRLAQWSYLRQKFIPYQTSFPTYEREITRDASNAWTYGEWIATSLCKQKVLWGGDLTSGMYMTAGHTATLSEKISDQASGIILVFCYYNGASDTDWSWITRFIPKIMVELEPGGGHTFELANGKFGSVGTKYLYINDGSIVGHADNNLTGTAGSGITYANNKFVLRYVLGV